MARARQEDSLAKLGQAGADRVVNPQELGAARMASFIVRPHVAEYIDVVMHERSLEFQMQELVVPRRFTAGRTRRCGRPSCANGPRCWCWPSALPDGTFVTNPDPDLELGSGHVLIAVGAAHDLANVEQMIT